MTQPIALKFISAESRVQDDGFLKAEVFIGVHREVVTCETFIWKRADYESHWEKTFEYLKSRGSIAFFCSSLEADNSDIWLACKIGDKATVFNLLVKRSKLILDNGIIRSMYLQHLSLELLQDEEASRWEVLLS